MANSQNGWPVDKTGASQDRNPIYGNVKVPNGVLAGDVATVLRWVAKRFHETVQPLVAGTCWGWFVKSIEGSTSISNHASGTAIDLNADQHPMGVAASTNFTPAQIAACHAIVKAAGGVIRWGGDYTGRPDPMHWEIVGSRSAVAAFAKTIGSTEEDDMRFPKKGDEGEVVKYWQLRLQATGFDPGAIDGIYGDKMEAAVNASRKAYGEGPHVEITGWHAHKIDQAFAAKYAGKDGAPGAPGQPGKDAVLSGTLTVTGGQLDVTA